MFLFGFKKVRRRNRPVHLDHIALIVGRDRPLPATLSLPVSLYLNSVLSYVTTIGKKAAGAPRSRCRAFGAQV